MLWICLHLPRLALDVFQPDEAQPVAVEHAPGQHRSILHVTDTALDAGVHPGMNVNTAGSVCSGLKLHVRDNTLEQRTLERLALLAYQFTPHLQIVAPDSLLLEVETSLRLFGGRDALLRHLLSALQDQGLRHALACFPAARGALVLARCRVAVGEAGIFAPEDLYDCPLSASDLAPALIEGLHGMGLETLGELFALPTSALGRRFGQGTLLYLQQLQGLHPDLRPHYSLPPTFLDDFELGHETSRQETLLPPLQKLLDGLENYLHARQLRALEVTLILHGRDKHRETLALRPAQGLLYSKEWLALFRLRLEQHPLRTPVLALQLQCSEFTPLREFANDLFDTRSGQQLSPEALVDRLQVRLGHNAVQGLRPLEDYRPERAWQTVPPGHPPLPAATPFTRPLWLLQTPRRLATRHGLPVERTPLQLLQGPERISSGWWDQQDVQRDYYIARNAEGVLYWIFHPLPQPQQWFLHGVFG